MTSGRISSGLAAFGGRYLRVASGCLDIGAAPVKARSGRPGTGLMATRTKWNTCPSRQRRSRPVPTCLRLRPTIFGSRLLALAAEPLRVEARLLGGGAFRLGLGSSPLCVDASRLCVRRWLLRLHGCPTRCFVRAGVFQFQHLLATRLFLLARDGDQSSRVRQPSLLATELRPLLLR